MVINHGLKKNWISIIFNNPQMNKLVPILLVVVLSGCAGEVKSPLENCADYNYENSTSDAVLSQSLKEKLNKVVFEITSEFVFYDSIEVSQKDRIDNLIKDIGIEPSLRSCSSDLIIEKKLKRGGTTGKSYYKYEVSTSTKDIATCARRLILEKPLKTKIQNELYEYQHERCEHIESESPKTFDAKWK